MNWPRHIELMLSHNEHNGSYMSVAEHCGCLDVRDDEWVSLEQQRKAIETGELWELHWYPNTPVGFCRMFAADLNALIAWMDSRPPET